MEDEVEAEPLFRPNKRRKVFRKRYEESSDDDRPVQSDVQHAHKEQGREGQHGEEWSATGVTRGARKAVIRNRGIGFSSAESHRDDALKQDAETALVLASPGTAQEATQNDRFVKPSGKVVTEDKHMMAYVDSKLAEARSIAVGFDNTPNRNARDGSIEGLSVGGGDLVPSQVTEAARTPNGGSTCQSAQAKSSRVYHRPTKRRPPAARDQSDIARDSMIDQLMRGSQIPIYDRTISQTLAKEARDQDNDTATAEAFKAQLLADMEQHRRKPSRMAAAAATGASTGPKLGGSRSQREKMRALEQEKASGNKK